eukprot:CAMPEP_0174375830 /NCGR_PEP_ID=MMETSP0811_2-20130205/115973_1 /TAXON_ID=73025 ORGANISM="Eutreptiella gymnastica-like, Strain CCMP1594" /NCGR_SAMPLE_ID=MMETSP0811_2 /ASSEMBLY_ACC=CAM_ASM_000667 /LENGTH=94 /DNA_ID=CAMNT_0015526443 /DNA_START=26 /DNA_END=310 /DNA_ORIENTATION=-
MKARPLECKRGNSFRNMDREVVAGSSSSWTYAPICLSVAFNTESSPLYTRSSVLLSPGPCALAFGSTWHNRGTSPWLGQRVSHLSPANLLIQAH